MAVFGDRVPEGALGETTTGTVIVAVAPGGMLPATDKLKLEAAPVFVTFPIFDRGLPARLTPAGKGSSTVKGFAVGTKPLFLIVMTQLNCSPG